MMKKLILVLFLFTLIPLAACNKMSVKDELETYLDERDQLIDRQIELATLAEDKFIFEEDYDLSLQALKEEVIPPFEDFLKDVKAVKLETEEVKDVHQSFVDAMDLQLEVYKNYEEAMENEDDQLFQEADTKVDEVNELLDNHEKSLVQLAKDHGIDLTLE